MLPATESLSSLRARGSSDMGSTGMENIIQRARGRVALLECTRSLVRVPFSGVSIVHHGSRQAKELANMFVGCPNIRPVCVGNVPRLAERTSFDDTEISFNPSRSR